MIPDCPHHITQRGNRQEDVFFTPEDRQRYLSLLGEYAAKHGMLIQAYCLMTNHVHLVVVPREATSLSSTLKPLHTRYTQHVNACQGVNGRLWQGRFFSCPLDQKHLWAAVKYVELNPVRAGLVCKAEDYLWSSAAWHVGIRGDAICDDPCEMSKAMTANQWKQWLGEQSATEDKLIATVRSSIRTGRPAGGSDFISSLEAKLGRVLKAKKIGRPKKTETHK
ncbi:MAG: transposase [Phycisphaerae bacterium]|nr:transposase [Phycisphaerae bacterium]